MTMAASWKRSASMKGGAQAARQALSFRAGGPRGRCAALEKFAGGPAGSRGAESLTASRNGALPAWAIGASRGASSQEISQRAQQSSSSSLAGAGA